MKHKPGDLFVYWKIKQAEPEDWGIPVTANSWGDWAGQQWENLKGLFGKGQAAPGAAVPPPVNTGSISQRLSRIGMRDLTSNPVGPATEASWATGHAPNSGLWRARMGNVAGEAEAAAPGAYQAANAMQQGLKPPGLLARAGKGVGGYLGRSFITGPVQDAADALSRKGVEHMTGGPVDEGRFGNLVSRGIGMVAPAMPLPVGIGMSAFPAAGRLGGAAAGNAVASFMPSSLGGNGQAAELGPKFQEQSPHQQAAVQKMDRMTPPEPLAAPSSLSESRRRDPFSVSFGPAWNNSNVTELRPVKPLR